MRIPALLDTGASEDRCHSIPSGNDLRRRYFCGASAEKYLKELSLYGIVLGRMLLAPILMFFVLRFFPVGAEIRLAMALITGMRR